MPVKRVEKRKEKERRKREKEEEEEERRGWSRCSVCGEEYSKDVRVIPGCLHSFCYDCIVHSSSTSSSCPICHSLISSPLPSLPVNYSLLTWLSLSPLSLSLPDDAHPYSDDDDEGEGDDDDGGDGEGDEEGGGGGGGVCEGCEEGPKELYCGECDRHYCTACSTLLHSIKVNRSHSLSPPISRSKPILPPSSPPVRHTPRSPLINSVGGCDHHHHHSPNTHRLPHSNSSLPSPLSSSSPSSHSSMLFLSSSAASDQHHRIRCEECGVHGGQEKRLYCVICNEFVCSICIDDHSDHKIISVFKYIDLIKEQWKSNLQSEIDHILYQFQNESKITGRLEEVNEEIAKLHVKLINLEGKKERYQKMIDDIHHLKLHFDLTNRFLLSFLSSLPPLPLSSFYSPLSPSPHHPLPLPLPSSHSQPIPHTPPHSPSHSLLLSLPLPSPPPLRHHPLLDSNVINHNNNVNNNNNTNNINNTNNNNINNINNINNNNNNMINGAVELHPLHPPQHVIHQAQQLQQPPHHDPRSDPILPLPSLYLPPSDHQLHGDVLNNNNVNVNNADEGKSKNIINNGEEGERGEGEEEREKKKEGRKRIKEFFDRENIQRIYSSFLPTHDNFFSSSPSFISKEEIEGRNQRIMENQLLYDENLILSFGNKGMGAAAAGGVGGIGGGGGMGGGMGAQFSSPYFIAVNLSKPSTSIAVSDYAKKRVGVFDSKGMFKYQLHLHPPAPNQQTNPWGVAIISKLNLLAVVDHSNHQIQLVDLESGEMRSRIGKGMGKEIGQFTNPRGIAYCSDLDLLAVCDQNNHRIQIFHLSSGEYHSSIPLTFQPWDIDISLNANLIVISDCCNHKVHLYSFLPLPPISPPHANQSPLHHNPLASSSANPHPSSSSSKVPHSTGEIRYRKIKEIGSGRERSENGQFSSPRGVGIHGKAKYFVVADEGNVRLQFFSLSGDFIASYNPSLLNGTPYFHRPFGIAIDKKDHVIAVSDPSLAKILLFKSPIF